MCFTLRSRFWAIKGLTLLTVSLMMYAALRQPGPFHCHCALHKWEKRNARPLNLSTSLRHTQAFLLLHIALANTANGLCAHARVCVCACYLDDCQSSIKLTAVNLQMDYISTSGSCHQAFTFLWNDKRSLTVGPLLPSLSSRPQSNVSF